MIRRYLFLLALIVGSLHATCTVALTSPTAAQSISGFAGPGNATPFTFQSANSGCTGVFKTQYFVDGYAVYEPGWGTPFSSPLAGAYTFGQSPAAPFSLPYNTYWNQAGAHVAKAQVIDVNGNVLATSAPVSFTTANTWPVACGDGSAPNSSLTVGSASAGILSITFAITGSCSTDTISSISCYIDGAGIDCGPGAPGNITLDETPWPNGNHQVCATWNNGTHHTTYASGPNGSTNWHSAGDQCVTVDFENGATASEARASCSGCYLTTGGTVTLSPKLYNTDGTLRSATWDYASSNTSVATVDGSGIVTGASSCPSVYVSSCSAVVYSMAELVSGTDLSVVGGGGNGAANTNVQSASHPFTAGDLGRYVKITGGSGWHTGLYLITHVDNFQGVPEAYLAGNAANYGTSSGAFTTGPTAADWVFVWPTNAVPCFGTDGAIHSSYSPACVFMHEGFKSSSLLGTSGGAAQPAGYAYGSGTGPLAEIDAGGINTWEFGIMPGLCSDYASTSYATFQSQLTSYIAGFNATISALHNAVYSYGTGDNVMRSGDYLYYCTRGNPAGSFGSGSAPWSTPIMAAVLGTLKTGLTYPMLGVAMEDEVASSWSGRPMSGPQQIGAAGSWLTGPIVCTGSACTATVSNPAINGAGKFMITGSTVSGMNNVAPATYTVSGLTVSSLSFSSTAAAGTYTALNDPNLTLEPYAAGGQSYKSNTDYIHNDAFAQLVQQVNTLGAGHINITAPPPANSSCGTFANWLGNNADGAIEGVSNFGAYADLYPAGTGGENFLTNQASLRAIVKGAQEMGYNTRILYGCYNPSLPLVILTDGIETSSGYQGYSVGVANISNDTLTFSAPHGIQNVVPGETRLSISGNTSGSANTQYLVLSVLSPTQLRVALAATDYTAANCTVGTITFSSGYTETPLYISATGTNLATNIDGAGYGEMYGQYFQLTSPDYVNLLRHRGENMTISGCTSPFNSHQYVYLVENINAPIHQYFFRELPSYSGTGGTAIIQPDSTTLCGRSACARIDTVAELHPQFVTGSYWECAVLHCDGTRLYTIAGANYNYDATHGFVGSYTQPATFAAATPAGISVTNEANVYPHWESSAQVPNYHAASIGALHLSRWRSLLFQPRLNSPDYGQRFSCGGDSGTNGAIVLCWNDSNSTQTQAFDATAYIQSGQTWATEYVCADGTDVFTSYSSATTTTGTLSVGSGCAVFMLFPASWTGFLNQPAITPRLADISGAASVTVHWTYDPYLMDVPNANAINCSSFPCVVPADKNIGKVYYRVFFLDSSGNILSRGDMQTF